MSSLSTISYQTAAVYSRRDRPYFFSAVRSTLFFLEKKRQTNDERGAKYELGVVITLGDKTIRSVRNEWTRISGGECRLRASVHPWRAPLSWGFDKVRTEPPENRV